MDRIYRHFIGTPIDPMLDTIVRAATAMCHAPIGMVTLVDEDREWLIARRGLAADSLPRHAGFCEHALAGHDSCFVVDDTANDLRFAKLPFVKAEPHIRAYAAATITANGHAVGALSVGDRRKRHFNRRLTGALVTLGRLAAMRLEQRELADLLDADEHTLPAAVAALTGEHERFRTFLDATGGGIMSLDLDGRCTFATSPARAMLGYPDGDPLAGQAIRSLIRRRDGVPYAEGCCPVMTAVLACRRAHLPDERFRCADGSLLPVECWVTPVMEHGRVNGGALAFVDVSERRRAEEASRRAIERRDRLMAIVAHDLRNPLQAIKLVMALDPLRSHSRVRRVVQKAVSRMERMIGLLLDYARTQTGTGLSLAPRHVDLATVLGDAMAELRAANPGRELVLDVDGDLSGEWDPDRLAQVVSNLVNNAIKFGSPGSEITCLARSDDTRVILAVHNYGDPIAEGDLPHLFDPFRRGQRESDGDRDGLGLGLYVVHAVATAHGGDVRVRSSRGEGTTFIVTLPRHTSVTRTEETAGAQ